tara:strand:+ start:450 stop:587 length:138 start_codon:yes stop_codon:yes gene_type:complete
MKYKTENENEILEMLEEMKMFLFKVLVTMFLLPFSLTAYLWLVYS